LLRLSSEFPEIIPAIQQRLGGELVVYAAADSALAVLVLTLDAGLAHARFLVAMPPHGMASANVGLTVRGHCLSIASAVTRQLADKKVGANNDRALRCFFFSDETVPVAHASEQ
jgi:hypothetical protein